MDRKASSLEPLCRNISNKYIKQPHEIDFHHYFKPKHEDLRSDWQNDRRICRVNRFVRKRIAKTSNQKSTSEGVWRMSDHVTNLQSQLHLAAASKEYIHHEICDVNSNQEAAHSFASPFLPTSMIMPAFGLPSRFCDLSSRYSCVGCFTAPSIVSNMLRTNSTCYPEFSRGKLCDGYDKGVPTTFIESDGHTFSPSGINLVSSEMAPSDEQVASIISCSDGDWYSHAGPFDGGMTYPGSSLPYLAEASSGNYIQQQHLDQGRSGELNFSRDLVENDEKVYSMNFASLLGKDLELPYSNVQISAEVEQRTPESSDDLASVIINSHRSKCEGLLQSRSPTGASQYADSSNSVLHNVLRTYINFKTMPMNVGESQIPFVNYIHSTACKDRICICEQCSILVSHFDNCSNSDCNICGPVRSLCGTRELPKNDSSKDFCGPDLISPMSKRLKMDNSVSSEGVVSHASFPLTNLPFSPEHLPQLRQWDEASVSDNSDDIKVISELLSRNDVEDDFQIMDFMTAPFHSEEINFGCKETEVDHTSISEITIDVTCSSQVSAKSDPAGSQTKGDMVAPEADFELGMKSEDPKILGVSLTDFFTSEQMKEHISSLRQCIGQSIAKEVSGDTMQHAIGEILCQLCATNKLLFAPEPKYCSYCGAGIKCNSIYYSGLDEIGTQHFFCTSCFRGSRGGKISFHGVSISKATLRKGRNSEENEEPWVQCDKCEHWQHQICALYNGRKDLKGKAEYKCPKCCLEEIEIGQRMPLPKDSAFGAKDLPRSMLSDYIEERLFRHLEQEREERAKALNKDLDEVPVAADLVVRVVLSVNKQLKVKQGILEIFLDDSYPEEFPYKSKVILLFQKIQGVDVCLFAMYVKEFGSECSPPNQRSVYISYIDSVKYFRPETRTVTGEALRTFVYHEILIGYLDYCKRRGFATCYIWACSPVKGEDYILYCHPEIQKRPRCDKLRQWYKSMLNKAIKEDIVVDITNLYDHFFVPNRECNTKISATRLPYFDGYYWSNVAEDMIRNIKKESGQGPQNKVKKMVTHRTLKAMGHIKSSGDATKDIMLMQKLGQTILPAKDDFIMVHLQFICTRCDKAILSGSRWFCNQCKKIQLCARCHDVELNLNKHNTHTCCNEKRHLLLQVQVNDMPAATDDKDINLENSFLEDRHIFLSFLQENHYQFDTLRRAKHSSMMVLYHLHNPSAPSIKVLENSSYAL